MAKRRGQKQYKKKLERRISVLEAAVLKIIEDMKAIEILIEGKDDK